MKSNILFGKKYEEERYEKVIKACALKKGVMTFELCLLEFQIMILLILKYKICQKFFLKKWKDF